MGFSPVPYSAVDCRDAGDPQAARNVVLPMRHMFREWRQGLGESRHSLLARGSGDFALNAKTENVGSQPRDSGPGPKDARYHEFYLYFIKPRTFSSSRQ